MRKNLHLFGIIIIVTVVFSLFLISTILIRKELIKGENEYKKYFQQFELLNKISSSLAHLSMWQLTYTKDTNDRERFLSRRRMKKISDNLPIIIDSLRSLGVTDSINMSRLDITVKQLIEAHNQIISKDMDNINEILLDSMRIDFRSVFDIVSFHVGTVQELSIHKENKKSKERYIGIIRLLVIEMAIIIVIVFIVYLTLYARKKAEKKLLEAEGYFNDVVNSMPSVLIGTDENGKILRINRAALNLCEGYDWIDKNIEDYFPQVRGCAKELKENIFSGLQFFKRQRYKGTNKQTSVYDIKSFPFSVSERKGAVVRLDDITQQENIEDQLRQTQKMNAIGQLAGGVAHDFNNTLGAILGAAEYINGGCSDDEKKEFLEMIINASNKASNLTRKLLTFARKNNQREELINLHDIITSSVTLLEHSINKRISISQNFKASNFFIKGDFSELQNVILNIGINAGHAMPEGGAITITTENIELNSEKIKSLPFEVNEGSYISIEISDTGIGISEENLKRIFEPFFTTKEHGTGIGLASVYGSVQQHKGTIDVNSTLGVGSTFTLYLPIITTIESNLSDKENKMVHGEGTILIIDDEEMIRRSLQLILKKLGYKTLFAENGRAGVEVFKEYRNEIKLIILDMIMPVMDGREALEELRIIDPNIPVILSSGYAHSDDIYRAKDLNIQGVLPKPYSGVKLSKLIANLIN